MAGQNIIRDSDDEDSDDAIAHPPLPAATISSIECSNVDAESSAPKHLRHSGEPSTGSTELLSREIKDACQSLLEPTPDGVSSTTKHRSSARQLSSSPAVARLKSRRATTNFAESKEKKPMITYSRTSQDDTVHFRSSGSGAEFTPRRRAQLATEVRSVQVQDAYLQPRDDQPRCTPMEVSQYPDILGLSGHVSSPTMSSGTPCTEPKPVGLDRDSVTSRARLSPQMSQSEPCFQNENEPIPNGVSLAPEILPGQGNDSSDNLLQDELSNSAPMPAPSNAKSKLSKLIRIQQERGDLPTDDPGSDEIIDGFPVEQYKPRPSRSRSGHGDSDLLFPVDYSKKPEKVAKRKKNRRKTTAFERQVHESEEDTEIFQTKNPVVLIENRSKVGLTLEAVKNTSLLKASKDHLPDVQDAEPVAPSVPSKKRGRPRKQAPESTEELDAPNAEGVIPLGSPQSKFAGESSTGKPLRKKRKISAEPRPPNVSDSESYDEDIELKPGSYNGNTILKELSDNKNLHLPFLSPSTDCTSSTSGLLSATNTSIPPQTPQKPVKGPDKHSPLASSKVAYRVGLSKRARIEPLLRILKK